MPPESTMNHASTEGPPGITQGRGATQFTFPPLQFQLENLMLLTKLPDLNVLTCRKGHKQGSTGLIDLQSPGLVPGAAASPAEAAGRGRPSAREGAAAHCVLLQVRPGAQAPVPGVCTGKAGFHLCESLKCSEAATSRGGHCQGLWKGGRVAPCDLLSQRPRGHADSDAG